MSAPEPVSVTAWGELPGETKVTGALRVLVGGQAAGGMMRSGDHWIAQIPGLKRSRVTGHASAEDALWAILRSSWGRRLGARAASDLHWSDRARRVVNRAARKESS